VGSARFPGQRLTCSRGNGSVEKPAKKSRNVSVDTNTHRTIEKSNGAMLPIRSAPKFYKEGRLQLNTQRAVGSANTFPWDRQTCSRGIGKHVPVGSANTFPWDRLGSRGIGKHVPGATAPGQTDRQTNILFYIFYIYRYINKNNNEWKLNPD
jgi:hypothetical protein